MSYKGKYWMFTTNDTDLVLKAGKDIAFTIEQPEEPPGVGWHRQCYVEFTQRMRAKAAGETIGIPQTKKGDKTATGKFYRLDPRMGTKEQAMAYCSSAVYCHNCNQGDHAECLEQMDWQWSYVWSAIDHAKCPKRKEKGKVGACSITGKPEIEGTGCKAGQGSQQQLILDAIKSGISRKQINEEFAGYCARYHAWVDKQFTYFAPVRKWMPDVYWLHGDAGTDKSRMARAVFSGSCYCKPPDTKWFDGYDGQEVLILNDLRKSTFTYSYLLDLLDRYEFRVEVKGGYVPLLAKVIIITCSKPHEILWAELGGTENENIGQLTRRIKKQFNVSTATDAQKSQLVHMMRKSVQHLMNSENWDTEDKYGEWDGHSEIPQPMLSQLKAIDDSTGPAVKKRRICESVPTETLADAFAGA